MMTVSVSVETLAQAWVGLFAAVLLAVLAVARLAALARAAAAHRQQAGKQTIVAEYVPPADLLPYELGFLYDNRFGDNELFAVLLVLAQKHAVTLVQDAKQGLLIHIRPLTARAYNALPDAEQAVYGAVRDLGGGQVVWGQVSSWLSETTGIQANFEYATRQQLQAKGYLSRDSFVRTFAGRRRAIAGLSLGLALLIFSVPLYVAYLHSQAAWATNAITEYAHIDRDIYLGMIALASLLGWGALYGYCQLVAYIYYRAAGLPVGVTPQLQQVWPAIVGYREFVRTVEAARLQADPNALDVAMPQCIAFGIWPVQPHDMHV